MEGLVGAEGGRSVPGAPAGLGTTRTRPRAPGPQGGPRGAPYVRRASGDAAGTPGPPPRSAGRAVPAGSQRPKRAASQRSNFFSGAGLDLLQGRNAACVFQVSNSRSWRRSREPLALGARTRDTSQVPPAPRVRPCSPAAARAPPTPFWRTPGRGLCCCAGSHALRSGPKFGVCCAACAPAERGWGPLRAARSFGHVQKHGVPKPQGLGRSLRAWGGRTRFRRAARLLRWSVQKTQKLFQDEGSLGDPPLLHPDPPLCAHAACACSWPLPAFL